MPPAYFELAIQLELNKAEAPGSSRPIGMATVVSTDRLTKDFRLASGVLALTGAWMA